MIIIAVSDSINGIMDGINSLPGKVMAGISKIFTIISGYIPPWVKYVIYVIIFILLVLIIKFLIQHKDDWQYRV